MPDVFVILFCKTETQPLNTIEPATPNAKFIAFQYPTFQTSAITSITLLNPLCHTLTSNHTIFYQCLSLSLCSSPSPLSTSPTPSPLLPPTPLPSHHHYRTCSTTSLHTPSPTIGTKLTANRTTLRPCSAGNPLPTTAPGRSVANNSSLTITNCATIAKMFKCTPYAKRKSQRYSTSGRGGVQAHNVSTEGKA